MKISIVIPAFNEERLLPATLAALRQAEGAWHERAWTVEYIVCDNRSTDATAAVAAAAGAHVVLEPINQIARARNTGARAATGEWLIFVDADSRPSYALLQEAAAAMAGGGVTAGGATLQMSEHRGANWVCRAWNGLSRWRRWFAGSFVFCRRDVFCELGGFSEAHFAGEEIELSRRLKRWARAHGERVVILWRHPMETSARKIRLYTPWEHLRFFVRVILGRGQALRERAACPIWYDGRR